MPSHAEPPSRAELEAVLGPAAPVWHEVLRRARAAHGPLTETWRPSKTGFGRMCLLQHPKRTLLYLTPDAGTIWVAIILGERAFQGALARALPDALKQRLLEARPHVEGRGIRFPIHALDELEPVATLLEIKTAPR